MDQAQRRQRQALVQADHEAAVQAERETEESSRQYVEGADGPLSRAPWTRCHFGETCGPACGRERQKQRECHQAAEPELS